MKILVFISLLLSLCVVDAATIEKDGADLVITGQLVEGDYDKFLQKFGDGVGVHRVVLDNCKGGLANIGFKISQRIRTLKLETIAKSQCHSSCAMIFLAGRPRKFSTSLGEHAILLHSSRNVVEAVDVASTVNPALMRYLLLLTNNRLSTQVLQLIENSTGSTQGVVFVQLNAFFSKTLITYYCDGSEHGLISNCKRLSNSDALAMGVISE